MCLCLPYYYFEVNYLHLDRINKYFRSFHYILALLLTKLRFISKLLWFFNFVNFLLSKHFFTCRLFTLQFYRQDFWIVLAISNSVIFITFICFKLRCHVCNFVWLIFFRPFPTLLLLRLRIKFLGEFFAVIFPQMAILLNNLHTVY